MNSHHNDLLLETVAIGLLFRSGTTFQLYSLSHSTVF